MPVALGVYLKRLDTGIWAKQMIPVSKSKWDIFSSRRSFYRAENDISDENKITLQAKQSRIADTYHHFI